MKQIRNIMMLIVVMFVCTNVSAQIIGEINYSRMEVKIGNAWYNCADIPGATHARRGDYVMTLVNNHFARLRHDNPEDYMRELNAWNMSGGLAGITPVRYDNTYAMGGGMMMNGGMVGGMMVGTGMQNTGMVMGNSGMAGAMSNVVIDNSNLAETIGSGINMTYDTGSNSLSISGDPITAGLRLVTAIGSKTKRNNRQQTQQVIYVDRATGQQVQPQATQQVVTRSAQQPQTTTRTQQQVRSNNNTVQQNQNTQYQIVFDSASGTYVQVPVR